LVERNRDKARKRETERNRETKRKGGEGGAVKEPVTSVNQQCYIKNLPNKSLRKWVTVS